MAPCRLRVYYGPEEAPPVPAAAEHQVTVALQEILPLLADAHQQNRTWLRDFADDAVVISADLYEVLLAYQHFRRPSA